MGNPASQYTDIVAAIRRAALGAGRDPELSIGFMPGWAYLTGPAPDDLPPAMNIGAEALATEMREAKDAGANTMHMKFRSRTKSEYLEQIDAFVETVVPLVDEP
jgi:hypothetical protein